ncbi:hypothetical protein V2J09_022761 [Rumex salicifolius]
MDRETEKSKPSIVGLLRIPLVSYHSSYMFGSRGLDITKLSKLRSTFQGQAHEKYKLQVLPIKFMAAIKCRMCT